MNESIDQDDDPLSFRTLLDNLDMSVRDLAAAVGISHSAAGQLSRDIWPKKPKTTHRIEKWLETLPPEAFWTVQKRLEHPGKGKGSPAKDSALKARENAPTCSNTTGAQFETQTTETQTNIKEERMLLQRATLTQKARAHFGLPRNPFEDDVHTRMDIFQSQNIRYVRAALFDAAMNHDFVAVIGESGAGKTTLVEDLEQRIVDENRPCIVIRPYIIGMEENDKKGKTLKSGAIAEAIIRTLDPTATIKSSPEARFNQAHELLKASRATGNAHLLLIEEAHCLPIATLKHLKRFLELKLGLSRLLGVALIGQPELKARLSEQKAEVREVTQRCLMTELAPLDNDLDEYLKFKFTRISVKPEQVLADDACDALRHRLTWQPRGGKATDAISICYPLVVGNLLIRAMNAAAAAGWPKVDAEVIRGI